MVRAPEPEALAGALGSLATVYIFVAGLSRVSVTRFCDFDLPQRSLLTLDRPERAAHHSWAAFAFYRPHRGRARQAAQGSFDTIL